MDPKREMMKVKVKALGEEANRLLLRQTERERERESVLLVTLVFTPGK
uniref:Uncharacterized protein n=1 Tax=Moniliophthora roreri TaxID=221103 RepID=A0A0W0FM16_MONRR